MWEERRTPQMLLICILIIAVAIFIRMMGGPPDHRDRR